MLIETLSAKTAVSTLASVAATAVIFRSVLRDYVPPELQRFAYSKLRFFFSKSLVSSNDLTLIFEEFTATDDPNADYGGKGFSHNHLFTAAKTYLNPTALSRNLQTTRFKASLPSKETSLAITMESNQEIVDFFGGVKLTWKFISSSPQTAAAGQNRFELRFHKRHRATVMDSYLPHVIEKSKLAKQEAKSLKIFTLKQGRTRIIRPRWMAMAHMWEGVTFDHPSTFATLAMDAAEKAAVVEDLKRFVERRGFYRSVGKAWKRGYLLYGPPGTGKTSLVAAMANFLKFDVYELELSGIRNNGELRKLVISIGNRSLLVVEDIDCAADLGRTPLPRGPHDLRRSEVTLSGLLNFIDGLWSSCGDERIIVLTTNHKDRLDPALLRPGRMDMLIHMSYCTPSAFKMLSSNYLGVTEHRLLPEIEKLLEGTMVTPAEIGEELLKNEDPEASLNGLIKFLETKKGNESQSSSCVA